MSNQSDGAQSPKQNGSSAQVYSIDFYNNSQQGVDVAIFQVPTGQTGVPAIAWRVEPILPRANRRIDWRETYDFVWAPLRSMSEGGNFTAAESVPAALSYTNEIEFTRKGSDYLFLNAKAEGKREFFSIQTTNLIPVDMVSVGLAMSGAPFFAVEANPSRNFHIAPGIFEYWIAAGQFSQGDILLPDQVANKIRIQFPDNIFNLKATLEPDFQWDIQNAAG